MALQEGITNQAALKQAEDEISDYFLKQIAKRHKQAGDDLLSFLINARSPVASRSRTARFSARYACCWSPASIRRGAPSDLHFGISHPPGRPRASGS